MALIQLKDIDLGYGGPLLLDGVSLTLERGERVALIGRNGTGKSTLMRVIGGEIRPDDGQIIRTDGLRVARLAQEVPTGLEGSVYDVVAGGLADLGALLARYHHVSHEVAAGTASLQDLERSQHALEAGGGWAMHQRIDTVVARLGLDPDVPFAAQSGGVKRRVLLARALVTEPDLLLLDEPTNHLDIGAIEWLEAFLLGYPGTLLFVTHDRMFLEHLATRIVELDRGRLRDFPGDHQTYLQRKAALLEAEEREWATFDKRLAQEEVWIRQGIKARRTRNEGRVRALEALRVERAARRTTTGPVRMVIQDAERSGKLVVEASHIDFSWHGQPLIRDLSTTILKGDRVGIIGPNGSGKTTLVRILLGELAPTAGSVRHGTNLQIAYFDQYRAALDPEQTVIDNLAEGRERLVINDQPRHVISYLQDFLFPPERCRQPVKALSGGERNRLLLAKLFAKPFNVLALDEPTNDLDAETLDLLEERLTAFTGTLLLISHDRAFLNNVATSTLVFEGDGRVGEYVGGYDDWLRQGPPPSEPERPAPARQPERARPAAGPAKRKLGYKEQRELESLPRRIEALETEQAALHARMADPAFFRQDKGEITAAQHRLAELETALAEAYVRWEALEEQAEG